MPPIDPAKLAAFLDELCQYGNVSESCAKAEVGRVTVYRHRKENPEFAKAWEEALAIGTQALEDEAKRRAFSGWEEPVIHQGRRQYEEVVDEKTGEVKLVPVGVRKYSDTLLIFLMKGLKPETYKERAHVQSEVSGPGGGPIQHMDLSKLTTDELRQLKALSDKASGT